MQNIRGSDLPGLATYHSTKNLRVLSGSIQNNYFLEECSAFPFQIGEDHVQSSMQINSWHQSVEPDSVVWYLVPAEINSNKSKSEGRVQFDLQRHDEYEGEDKEI
jgi:hypothetical protein